jgi:hypothetical protein
MRRMIINKFVAMGTVHGTPGTAHVTPGLTRGPFLSFLMHYHQKWIPGQARNDGNLWIPTFGAKTLVNNK